LRSIIGGELPLRFEAIKLSSQSKPSRLKVTTPSEPDPPGLPDDPRSGWGVVQVVLGIGALVLAVLPAVVAAFGLLPVYRMHARFLVFYTPFACLLVLAYLFYVRDWLVRVLFARFLQASREPHYSRHEPFYKSWQRAMERAGSTALRLAPGLLFCVSFYSLSRYTTRLNESIALAGGMYAERLELGGEIDDSTAGSDARAIRELPTEPGQPAEVRAYVLRETAINDIPFFGELTVLYITAFAAAPVALLLMALKEYGRTTLGISDEELVLGRPHESDS
jgi:hypothetical protein